VRGIYQSAVAPAALGDRQGERRQVRRAERRLDYCHTPLFCSLDADTALERDALLRLCRSFLENGDTIAAGGIVRVANGSTFGRARPRREAARTACSRGSRWWSTCARSWPAAWAGRAAGAADRVRRVRHVPPRRRGGAGGYSTRSVGEDMELIVRLHRYMRERKRAYDISFVPDPVAWTEVPESCAC
jgi:cellulose synthase/poly-beta-1,6-N-acetylglucosamine synthase-like glycosyltransferase